MIMTMLQRKALAERLCETAMNDATVNSLRQMLMLEECDAEDAIVAHIKAMAWEKKILLKSAVDTVQNSPTPIQFGPKL